MKERRELWASRGRQAEEQEGLKGMTVGCLVDAKAGKGNGDEGVNGH